MNEQVTGNENENNESTEQKRVTLTTVIGHIFSFIVKRMVRQNGETKEVTDKYTLKVEKLIALPQKGEPAPGILFSTTKNGVATLPIQFGGYSGGEHIDLVQPDRTLKSLVRWGYDPKQSKRGAPEYAPQVTSAWVNGVFEACADVLDSQEGVDFCASLKSEEAKAAANENRAERDGFKRILAVNGSHHAIARRTSTPEEYMAEAARRKEERESGQATRTVDEKLPF